MTPLLLCIGVLIGAVLGLTGAGGSLLAVPLLLLLLNLDPSEATGLALGVVAFSSAYGTLARLKYREILWVPAALFGASGMAMAPIGRHFAAAVDPTLLVTSFVVLSSVIAAHMFWQSIKNPDQASVVRAGGGGAGSAALFCRFSENRQFEWRLRCITGLIAGGVVTGLLSGFFGVGGGFLIVPFLTQLNGVSMLQAVATSLAIVTGISASGFATHLLTQSIDIQQLLLLGVGGIGGMMLGSLLVRRLAGAHLQRIFAMTIIVMAVILIAR